ARRALQVDTVDLDSGWRGSRRAAAWGGGAPGTDDPSPARPRLEHYLARFPDLGAPDQLSVGLVLEEYRARTRWGDRPGHAEYLERFAPLGPPLGPALHAVHAELAAATSGGGGPPPPEGAPQPAAAAGPAAGSPPVGRLGRYALGGLLGAGGFGTVWKSRHTGLGRDVAVKLPRCGWFTSVAEEERFLREARAAAPLRHPGI